MRPLNVTVPIGRRTVGAGAVGAALIVLAGAQASRTDAASRSGRAPITSAGQKPFVPAVGDWEGTVDGFPASFELVYEPGFVVYQRPPYGYEDLTTMDPASCPLAANRYSATVVGRDDVTPLGIGGTLPLAAEGIGGRILGPGSATLSSSFDTGRGGGNAACSGTLTRSMHPAKRRTVDDGAWTLRFADGETQTLTVSAGGRVATGIEFPRALGRCGGPYGNLNLFIGPNGRASLKGPGGAYTLSLGFTGATRASGALTTSRGSCRGFRLGITASLAG